MNDKREKFASFVQTAHDKGFFNGAWLYAENGVVVSSGARGTGDPEQTLPLDTDSVFDLASVSKHFTAAAVLLLVRRGKVGLDDDIRRYFPGIPYAGRTVRQLLHHTAGLPDYMEWVAKYAEQKQYIPGNESIEAFLCQCGLPELFAPGEKWCYSNTGYALLSLLVERLSGVPFPQFMAENIFRPAGMERTCIYHRRKNGATIRNYAFGLVWDKDAYRLPDEVENTRFVIPLDGIEGDGVVNSSVNDLLRWDRALHSGAILTAEEQALMYTGGTCRACGETGYGFGWMLGSDRALGRIVRHDGGWPGYHTRFLRLPDADRVLILLSNRTGRDTTADTLFFNGMVDIAMDREPQPVQTLDELILPEYDDAGWAGLSGAYRGPLGDTYRIVLQDGQLRLETMYREESPMDAVLYPVGPQQFRMREFGWLLTFRGGALLVDDKIFTRISD